MHNISLLVNRERMENASVSVLEKKLFASALKNMNVETRIGSISM